MLTNSNIFFLNQSAVSAHKSLIMKKTMMMFFVTLAASFDANAQTGKVGFNLQDSNHSNAKVTSPDEEYDWIMKGTPVPGIIPYNNRLVPGAAEYAANAMLARQADMTALSQTLSFINVATKGALRKENGKVLEVSPDVIIKNEGWLRSHTKPVKVDFGKNPIAMYVVNLVTKSLDTIVHADGLGVQDVHLLDLGADGKFPIALAKCGNKGGEDFIFSLMNGTAKIVRSDASAAAPDPNSGLDPELAEKIKKSNQKGWDDFINTGGLNSGAPVFYMPVTVVTGGNTQTVSGGGRDGKDGKDGRNSTSTSTTKAPQRQDFTMPVPGTPGQSLYVNAPTGWVAAQNPATAQVACGTCTGTQQQQSWTRQDVALVEQQGQTNNAYNAAMLKQLKTANVINGINMGANLLSTGFQIAGDFGAFNQFKPVPNIIIRNGGTTPPIIPRGLGGGPIDFPNGIIP